MEHLYINKNYLRELWKRIKDIPKDEGTQYEVSLDDGTEEIGPTTYTNTIIGHLRSIYQSIINIISKFTGGSVTDSGKEDSYLLKVDVASETGVPSVDLKVTTKDNKNANLVNTQLASKEYVDQKEKNVYDAKYLVKSTQKDAALNVDNKGSVANFSTNGQAYLAVRPRTGAEFLPQISQPYAGAAFGVKLDGTSAFSHKTYTAYDSKTGNYSGARNTAILQFAGPVGLRYAKNTGAGSDVDEDMYKYVGVIDSPDEFQRVYSASQVDEIISGLINRISVLEGMLGIVNEEEEESNE